MCPGGPMKNGNGLKPVIGAAGSLSRDVDLEKREPDECVEIEGLDEADSSVWVEIV